VIWTAEAERSTLQYADAYWWSNDGLQLHYRDYPGDEKKPPILCLPGLMRNARDFDQVAQRLSPAWRILALDFRGRGESAYAKDPLTYVPLTYAQDVERLLSLLDIDRFVAIGTSLGGIVTMLMAASGRAKIAGAILNDIGPELEPEGLARIKALTGRSQSWPTWIHAARSLEASNATIFPQYKLDDFLAMAKRLYRLTRAGRVVPDYDFAISEPLRLPGGEGAVGLWPALDALSDTPTLLVRGALSDVVSVETVKAMLSRLNNSDLVTVPDVGHAPTLAEPKAIDAIDRFLARLS
jgi:pimeloyl-ACP methyl ester carboxylesterase